MKAEAFYIREVMNLSRLLPPYDSLWLDTSQELAPGIVIKHDLPHTLLARVDQIGRACDRPGSEARRWFIKQMPGSSIKGYQHLIPDSWALELVPIALLLTLGPLLRFGPRLGVKAKGVGWNFNFEEYDLLWTAREARRSTALNFIDSPPSIETVRTVFTGLVKNWSESIVTSSCDQYVLACLADRQDKAIISLSIGLECLYLLGESRKRLTIARRAATHVADVPEERANAYRDLGSLYLARNAIIHNGDRSGRLQLGNGVEITWSYLVRVGLRHLASTIATFLKNGWQSRLEKAKFIASLDARASESDGEFQAFERTFFRSLPKR
jgi:hypothetical protein